MLRMPSTRTEVLTKAFIALAGGLAIMVDAALRLPMGGPDTILYSLPVILIITCAAVLASLAWGLVTRKSTHGSGPWRSRPEIRAAGLMIGTVVVGAWVLFTLSGANRIFDSTNLDPFSLGLLMYGGQYLARGWPTLPVSRPSRVSGQGGR